MSPHRLRVGLDDYQVVPVTDILRVHDQRHARRVLQDHDALDDRERDQLVEQLAAGTVVLVRTERFRPPLAPLDTEPIPALPRPAPSVPRSAPTWLGLHVRHDSGAGYPGATFILELPDGSERVETLDDTSRWRGDGIPSAGTCRVRFDPPLRLAAARQRERREPLGDPAETHVVLRRAGTVPVRVRSSRETLLVVPRSTAWALEVGDLHFGTGRAVVLPAAPEGTTAGTPTPLDIVAAALAHIATASPRPLALVVGHTDTTGSDETNDRLSTARATSVDLLLRGDRSGWAAHAQQHHADEDVQRILQWAAVRQGWACDPGPIDGIIGPATRAARRAFREGYNLEMAGSLPLHADTSAADFGAIFELYTQELAVLLSDLGDPAALWPVVRSRSLGIVGCGERWPVQAVDVDGYACDDNRRVEILLFDLDDLPDLSHDVPGFDLYGSSRYRFETVPARPRIRLARVQLRDVHGTPQPSTEYAVTGVQGAHAGTTDALGFTEPFLATEGASAIIEVGAVRYRVTVTAAAPEPSTDARSQLNALGHYAGRLDADGGHARAAIRNFQWVHSLPICGELDAATTDALRRMTGS
ncbi:MAG: hypothetical protein AB1Z98_20810 [Nannocystaceae bacterium]